ncbi:MAG: peptidyl-prolyl cis-trans isomerase [Alistipes sp.]|nr:peptidyl-prolyl cis-trans isomerase [Alistipes sp.]
MKNPRNKIVLALWLLLTLAACKRLPGVFEGDRVLARAGKLTLRQMDVEALFPAGITGDDSVKWVENYVDRWVRDNLKLQEATTLFGDDAADEALVEAYRNSLITRRLEQHFIERQAGDSLYTEQDLHDYYNEHRGEFVLDRSIVKGRVVAFPTSLRQKARLREMFASWGGDARDEVRALASKNNFTLQEVDAWTEWRQFLAFLPTRRNASYDDLLARGGVQEMTDGGTTYWFVVAEARKAGDTNPYELVSEVVRQSVATRRRAEIVKASEDSIYRMALLEKRAVINL